MSDDLVKELRWYNSNSDASKKMHRAADRIEKLEAALRKFANCVCESNCDEKSGQVCQLWACRKALEEKDD